MILKRVILKCVASACTCYMCSAGIAHSVAEWNPPLESFRNNETKAKHKCEVVVVISAVAWNLGAPPLGLIVYSFGLIYISISSNCITLS